MKKAGWIIILFSQLFIIVAFWAWNHSHHPMGNLLTGGMAGKLLAYGRLAGLLAAFGIILQLILVGRIKWVEQVFGLDRMIRLHHTVGFSILIFLFAHPIFLTAGHALQAGTSQKEQFIDFCRNWPGVLSATIAFGIMIVAFWFCILIVKKRMRYESWYVTHMTFYIAIALAFSHQLAVGSDFTDNPAFALYWKILYVFTFANLILYRFLRPVWFLIKHRFIVSRVVAESRDTTSVYIEGRKMDQFRIQAGQFMIVRFWAPGFRLEAHPFSMSMRPDGRQIRLTIKALGDFTKRIPEIKPGVPVYIDGPHGVFTVKSVSLPKILMIAAGIGITPVRSLSEALISLGHDVIILYGNRNSSSIIFKAELEDLERKSCGKMHITHILSDEPEWKGEKGRIDNEKIKRLVPDVKERDVFLCGPPPMMKALRSDLVKSGIKKKQIHFERFAL